MIALPSQTRIVDALLAAAVLTVLVLLHLTGVLSMVELWNNSPMYSYGFAVPVISAVLLWTRREHFRRLTPMPSSAVAGLFLAAAFALLLASRAGGIVLLEQVSLIVSLLGAVVFVYGLAYLNVGWAAFGYLVLMVPVWDVFTEPLHVPFQNRSATIGVAILQFIGIPVYREGTFIVLPNATLEVAKACSGVNYLIAVLALGLPLSYTFLRGFWRRIALVASAVVIAALSNGLRVALIGALVYWDVGSPLHGPFHVLHGLFVAGMGYVALLGGVRLLSRGNRELATQSSPAPPPSQVLVPRTRVAVLLLLLAGAGVFIETRAAQPVPLSGELSNIPSALGRWTSVPGFPVAATQSWWVGADQEVMRRYRSSDGRLADVYVGYFNLQQQRKELVSFRDAELHAQATPVDVRLENGHTLSANLVKVLQGKDGPAVFWYEIDGSIERADTTAKLRTVWNSISRRRSNGAVVMLSSQGIGDQRAELSDLQELAAALHVSLGRLLPGRPSLTTASDLSSRLQPALTP